MWEKKKKKGWKDENESEIIDRVLKAFLHRSSLLAYFAGKGKNLQEKSRKMYFMDELDEEDYEIAIKVRKRNLQHTSDCETH